MLKRIWWRWLKIAHIIGTVQMMMILTVLYLLVVPWMAIPFKVLTGLRRDTRVGWVDKDGKRATIDSMRYQY